MGQLAAQWRKWGEQFAARTLRERALIAGGSVAVVVLLFDAFVSSPLAVQHKRLAGQIAEARAAIKAGEQMIAGGGGRADPDEVKRRYRDELQKQIAELDSRLRQVQKQLVPPEQVTALLEGVLSRERGLALVSLRKLPVQRFQTPGEPAAKNSAAGERGIYQHSFEIVIEGGYVDLHGYLARMEKLPWQLFWGSAVLDATKHPRLKLTLTVHTLSMDKIWLVV